jgi:endogenous inhibitor of DNA gyrase (YacG/DUF329 family)
MASLPRSVLDAQGRPGSSVANSAHGNTTARGGGGSTPGLARLAPQAGSAARRRAARVPAFRAAGNALGWRVMKSSPCPICKGPREAAGHNPTYPFCSTRCKLADLSNWINERYTLEAEPASPEDVEAAAPPPAPTDDENPTFH